MSRLFVFVLLLFNLAGAASDFEGKRIRTKADFIELENVLKDASKIESGKSNYYLGLLYSASFVLENGETINPDRNKAMAFFQKAYEGGKIMAAFNIAMLMAADKRIDEAIFVLDTAIRSVDADTDIQNIPTGAYLTVALAGLIMDVNYSNEEAVELGIKHLEKYVHLSDIPTGDYILSRMYLHKGEIDNANKYLTKACSNPKLPAEIKTTCRANRRI